MMLAADHAAAEASPPLSDAIASVQAQVLRAREAGRDLDGSSETLLIEVHDADGRCGIGETDGPAEACRSLIMRSDAHPWSRGLAQMLIGHDPFERGRLWSELAAGTIYDGEAGISRHALAGVDIALHDLVGKQLGRPVHSLLGGQRRGRLNCYATVYDGAPGDRDLGELMDDLCAILERAVVRGSRRSSWKPCSTGSATTGRSSSASGVPAKSWATTSPS